MECSKTQKRCTRSLMWGVRIASDCDSHLNKSVSAWVFAMQQWDIVCINGLLQRITRGHLAYHLLHVVIPEAWCAVLGLEIVSAASIFVLQILGISLKGNTSFARAIRIAPSTYWFVCVSSLHKGHAKIWYSMCQYHFNGQPPKEMRPAFYSHPRGWLHRCRCLIHIARIWKFRGLTQSDDYSKGVNFLPDKGTSMNFSTRESWLCGPLLLEATNDPV